MVKDRVTRFRWFWAWQDEKEEAWLGEMSRRGLHLASVGLPCFYTFIRGEPRNMTYRLDYQPYTKKEREDYLQLFRDAGWEHVGEMAAWQYFRKEAAPGENPEIYTDIESKVAKYKRLLGYLLILLAPLWVILIIQFGDGVPYPWLSGIKIFGFVVGTLLLYAAVRVFLRIRQLRRL